MPRLSPTQEILRALFARSGNKCAFPGCPHALINEHNQFIAQVCHIEAALPGGERYNPLQTDEERRSYDNLLLLCYQHHVETNNIEEWTVDRLKEIKAEHEAQFLKDPFKINETALYRLVFEMESYWGEIELLNTVRHNMREHAVEIGAKANALEIFDTLESSITALQEKSDWLRESDENIFSELVEFLKKLGYKTNKVESANYYNNPFVNRNWEIHNLAMTNIFTRIFVDLLHLKIKFLEEYLKTNSNDLNARTRFNKLKEQFKKIAQSKLLVD